MTLSSARYADTLTAARRFEQLLTDAGAPIVGVLRPPADPDALREIQDNTGLRFPAELLAWYAWHDGADSAPELQTTLPPAYTLLSLSESLMWYNDWLQASDDFGYDPQWWPIAHFVGGIDVLADCSGATDAPAPIRIADARLENEPDPTVVRAASVPDLLNFWSGLLEDGWWRFDRDKGTWVDTYKDMPQDLCDSGLA